MARRTGLAASVGLALLASGCASWGLSPVPRQVEAGRGLNLGLDLTPDNVSRAPNHGMGLDAFPEEVASGDNPGTGLSPFPYSGEEVAAPAAAAAPAEAPPPKAPTRAPRKAPPVQEPVESTPVAAAPEPPRPAPRLALQFRKGDSSHLMAVTGTVTQSPMFGEEGMVQELTIGIAQEVTELRPDGVAVLQNTVESFGLRMANPMMGLEVSFDTRDEASMDAARENPQVGPAVDMFLQMVGQSMEMAVRPDGEIVEAGSFEAMEQMMGGMGGSSMGRDILGFNGTLSPEPIREGLSWSYGATNETPLGVLTTAGKMTVASWDAAAMRAVLRQEGRITRTAPESVDESDPQAQMLAMVEMKDATINGEVVLDLGTGRVLSSRSVTLLEMSHPMMGDLRVEKTSTLERAK